MLTLDGCEFEAEGRRDSLQLTIEEFASESGRVWWSFSAVYRAVGPPMPSGDFAGQRTLRVESSIIPCRITHWHELEGQCFDTGVDSGGMSFIGIVKECGQPRICDRFEARLTQRDGYRFSLECRGSYTTMKTRLWEEDDAGERPDPDMALYLVEELPLADVCVRIPRNAAEPLRYALRRAETFAGLAELEPWPGRAPDFIPRWGAYDGARSDSQELDLVTPWARAVVG